MNWDDLLPEVLPSVPGCPNPMAKSHLRQAAIDFCRDTHAWREEIVKVYPVKGATRYQLQLPEGSELTSVACATQGDKSVSVSVNVFGLMVLDHEPDDNEKPITVTAILQPASDSNGMPDWFAQQYRMAFVYGALARLCRVPGVDWTNPELGMMYDRDFRSQVTDARVRLARGNTDRPLRVTPQPFL